ncbi:MAG: MFS transporter, partial [Deltaproteobacteria bacterium]|nr:MFS transporter [Deltaproteobacteria bacterium]
MVALSVFSIAMFILFLRIEKRSREPLLSLHFFQEKIFSVSAIASSLGNMAVFGAAIYFPLYLQSVRGESATKSGFIMMPMMVSMILASNVAGMLVSRFRRFKAVAVGGLFLSSLGMFCFGFFGAVSTTPALIAFSSLAGIGLGLTFPIFMVAPQSLFPPQQIGVVISLMQFFRSLGGSIGSAIFGAILIAEMNSGMRGISLGQLPASVAELVKNPGVIANPLKIATIREGISPAILGDFDRFVALCVRSISGSIETIFLVSAGLLLAALLLVLYSFNEQRVVRSLGRLKKRQ